ncbi:GAF and ANTAR domain-containing protein [Streptomyces sp. NPDC050315]|uniref:GAF and ANTAR domain-containing protein n=1 Tax=Streptomyces sp. NPDC050315 TaxID=3155039 RepID=UPI003446D0B7
MPDPTDPAHGEQEPAFARALLNLVQVRADTTTATLTRCLVGHCLDLLPVDSAGVMLVAPAMKAGPAAERAAVEVAATSHEVLRPMEAYEIESAQGPCMEALRTGRPHNVPDFAVGRPRWPGLALRAAAAGYRAMWAEPLCDDDRALGVVHLYRRTTGPLSPRHQERARSLARAAAAGLLLQRTLTDYQLRAEQLQQALWSRIPIEQAKGILAARLVLSPNAAFGVLRTHARAQQMRLHDLAGLLIDDPAGPWPPPPPRPNGQGR